MGVLAVLIAGFGLGIVVYAVLEIERGRLALRATFGVLGIGLFILGVMLI